MLHMPSSPLLVLQLQLAQHCHTVLSASAGDNLSPHAPSLQKALGQHSRKMVWFLEWSCAGQELDEPRGSLPILDILQRQAQTCGDQTPREACGSGLSSEQSHQLSHAVSPAQA